MKKKIVSTMLAFLMCVSCLCPIQTFAAAKGFKSDTTQDFTVMKDKSYTFKLRLDNSNAKFSVDTGNCLAAVVSKCRKSNNDYYATIHMTGMPNEKVGIYAILNNVVSKICVITIGYPVETTGKYVDWDKNKNGDIQFIQKQRKGWQIQIDETPVRFKYIDNYDSEERVKDFYVQLDHSSSSVNQYEKYIILAYGGVFNIDDFDKYGLKITNASGQNINYEKSGFCQIKVPYNNIDDIKTMYFGTNTDKVKLNMVYFK